MPIRVHAKTAYHNTKSQTLVVRIAGYRFEEVEGDATRGLFYSDP